MNTPRPTPPLEPSANSLHDAEGLKRSRRKKESIYAAVAFVLGFIVLPLLIYMVGILLLGPYAGGKSLWVFLGEFYNNLLRAVPRTWFIVLSPYLAFWVVRLSFRPSFFGKEPPEEPAETAAPVARSEPNDRRREPFISP
jgi:sterol desaturase/sphingolipid hydroxylase (fatty acid hydroxylase superfamily)